jgi:hypothetical protein
MTGAQVGGSSGEEQTGATGLISSISAVKDGLACEFSPNAEMFVKNGRSPSVNRRGSAPYPS